MARKWVCSNWKKTAGVICAGLLCGVGLYALSGSYSTAEPQNVEAIEVTTGKKAILAVEPTTEAEIVMETVWLPKTDVEETTVSVKDTIPVTIVPSTTKKVVEETTVQRKVYKPKVFVLKEERRRVTVEDIEEETPTVVEETTEAETVVTNIVPETTTVVVIGEAITSVSVEETTQEEELLPMGFEN